MTGGVSLHHETLLRALETALGSAAQHLDPSTVRMVEVDAGHLLCDSGDVASTAWVVVTGRLRASTVDAKGRETHVAVHGPGQFVGESALLEIVRELTGGEERILAARGPGEYVGELGPMLGQPRSATARATEPTVVVAMSLQEFRQHGRAAPTG